MSAASEVAASYVPEWASRFQNLTEVEGVAVLPKVCHACPVVKRSSRFVELCLPDVGALRDAKEMLCQGKLGMALMLVSDTTMVWITKVYGDSLTVREVNDLKPLSLNVTADFKLMDLLCTTSNPDVIIVESPVVSRVSQLFSRCFTHGPVLCMCSFDYTPMCLPVVLQASPLVQRIVLPPNYDSMMVVGQIYNKCFIDKIIEDCIACGTNLVLVTEKSRIPRMTQVVKEQGHKVIDPCLKDEGSGSVVITSNVTIVNRSIGVYYLDDCVVSKFFRQLMAMHNIVIAPDKKLFDDAVSEVEVSSKVLGCGVDDVCSSVDWDPQRFLTDVLLDAPVGPTILNWDAYMYGNPKTCMPKSGQMLIPLFGSHIKLFQDKSKCTFGYRLTSLKGRNGANLLEPTLWNPTMNVPFQMALKGVHGSQFIQYGSTPVSKEDLTKFTTLRYGCTPDEVSEIGAQIRQLVTFINGIWPSPEGYTELNPLVLMLAANSHFPQPFLDHCLAVEASRYKELFPQFILSLLTPAARFGMAKLIRHLRNSDESACDLPEFKGEHGRKVYRTMANEFMKVCLVNLYSLHFDDLAACCTPLGEERWRHGAGRVPGYVVQDAVADLFMSAIFGTKRMMMNCTYNVIICTKFTKHKWLDEFGIKGCSLRPDGRYLVDIKNLQTDIIFSITAVFDTLPDELELINLTFKSFVQAKKPKLMA